MGFSLAPGLKDLGVALPKRTLTARKSHLRQQHQLEINDNNIKYDNLCSSWVAPVKFPGIFHRAIKKGWGRIIPLKRRISLDLIFGPHESVFL